MSSSIETIKEYTGAGFKCALFDFDGTISLIREGWQKVMVPYFCEVIEALGTGESEDGIREEVTEFVDRLTGKQTIFQCIALDEAVAQAVRELRKRGADHVKIHSSGGVASVGDDPRIQLLRDDELKAIVETAHSLGMKVASHAHGKPGIDAAIRAGVDSI